MTPQERDALIQAATTFSNLFQTNQVAAQDGMEFITGVLKVLNSDYALSLDYTTFMQTQISLYNQRRTAIQTAATALPPL